LVLVFIDAATLGWHPEYGPMHKTKIAALLLLTFLLLGASSSQAAVIYLDSGTSANQYNGVTGANVAITPNQAWNPNGIDAAGNPYVWISFENTGDGPGAITLPNVDGTITGAHAANPTATFYMDFVLNSAAESGSITVWADDTARVYMDNTMLIDANGTQGSSCAAGPVSCAAANGAVLDLTSLDLQAGSHTLRVEAYQRSGSVFGVQYTGSIVEQTPSETPEPSTFGLLGSAMIGLGCIVRRRWANNS
jgi:hypothetical protein